MGRRLTNALYSHQNGFTLVELLLSGAILVVILGVVTSVLFSTLRPKGYVSRERVQRAQLAVNQIGEDVTGWNWSLSCAYGPCADRTSQSLCPNGKVPSLKIQVAQPIVDQTTSQGGNPGYLLAVQMLEVQYSLPPTSPNGSVGTLKRQVVDLNGATYVNQELATDLIACNKADSTHTTDSSLAFEDETGKGVGVLRVVLRTKPQGVNNNASVANVSEVRGAWFIR